MNRTGIYSFSQFGGTKKLLIYLSFHSNDFYRNLLNYLFITPMDYLSAEIGECYSINNTCGIDVKVLRKLVSSANFFFK